MPKMKTRRAAKKRFKVTATGKVRFQRSGMRHNMEIMSGTDQQRLGQTAELAPEFVKPVKRMLGQA